MYADECWYGWECRRRDCWFDHSDGRRIDGPVVRRALTPSPPPSPAPPLEQCKALLKPVLELAEQLEGWQARHSWPVLKKMKAALYSACPSFDPNVAGLIAEYLQPESFHCTFLPVLNAQQQPQSPFLSKWDGRPYIATGSSWPTCQHCPSSPPLAFMFQLREWDYPYHLRQACTLQPPSASSSGSNFLFQFFLCLTCAPMSQSSRVDASGRHFRFSDGCEGEEGDGRQRPPPHRLPPSSCSSSLSTRAGEKVEEE